MNDNEGIHRVDVVGFNPTERSLLTSIFALAARRDPAFVQNEAGSGLVADAYLVDADDPAAFASFRELRSRFPAPAVLVGTSDRGSGLPLVARPMQWARLLQSLDDAVAGGAIPVLQAVDEGAFDRTMVLNRTGAPRPAGATVPTPRPRAPAPAPARERRPMDRVLVVDDNATVRAFMQAKLAPFGFEADFAETGEQAVGLTGNTEYTCVFLDVVLPGIDGYQVCKLIKSNKQAVRKTAVVMLTSRGSPFDKLRGSLAGCDEYLTKPVDEDRLLEVIAKFLPLEQAGARK